MRSRFPFRSDAKRASIALAAAVSLAAPAARAEWVFVSQDGFSRIYMDPASRTPLGGGEVDVEALTDYDPQAPEAASFKLSEKGLSEIESVRLDCAKARYGSHGGSWFAGHMGSGSLRSAYPAKAGWSTVPDFYAGLFAKICAHK